MLYNTNKALGEIIFMRDKVHRLLMFVGITLGKYIITSTLVVVYILHIGAESFVKSLLKFLGVCDA